MDILALNKTLYVFHFEYNASILLPPKMNLDVMDSVGKLNVLQIAHEALCFPYFTVSTRSHLWHLLFLLNKL